MLNRSLYSSEEKETTKWGRTQLQTAKQQTFLSEPAKNHPDFLSVSWYSKSYGSFCAGNVKRDRETPIKSECVFVKNRQWINEWVYIYIYICVRVTNLSGCIWPVTRTKKSLLSLSGLLFFSRSVKCAGSGSDTPSRHRREKNPQFFSPLVFLPCTVRPCVIQTWLALFF